MKTNIRQMKGNWICSKSIYLIQCFQYYKIGVSENPEKRLNYLSYNTPFKMNLIHKSSQTFDFNRHEQNLHYKYRKQCIKGEWFELNSSQTKDIIIYLDKIEL